MVGAGTELMLQVKLALEPGISSQSSVSRQKESDVKDLSLQSAWSDFLVEKQSCKRIFVLVVVVSSNIIP